MRHYTNSDQLYYSDIKSYRASATDVASVLEIHPASKTVLLRNDGPNDVFIGFDTEVVNADCFKLTQADGLVRLRVQVEKLAFICAAGESATIRVSSNY